MMKTANVEFVKRVEIGGAYVTVLVRGEVGAVRSSVEAGADAAGRVGQQVCTNVIPSAHADTFELIGVGKQEIGSWLSHLALLIQSDSRPRSRPQTLR
jgi:ethanolamine utilization protein EutM